MIMIIIEIKKSIALKRLNYCQNINIIKKISAKISLNKQKITCISNNIICLLRTMDTVMI